MLDNFIKERRRLETGFFVSPVDGTKLFYYQSFPEIIKVGKPTYHLILVHGAFEYHARHETLHNYFATNFPDNIIISAFDLRGHGLSEGIRSHVENFQFYCEDLLAFLSLQKNLSTRVDFSFVLGHSMGGLIVAKTLAEFSSKIQIPLTGFILSNPAMKIKSFMARKTRKLVKFFSYKKPYFRSPLVFSLNDLGRDKDSVRNYKEDPLITKSVSLSMVRELMETSLTFSQETVHFKIPSLSLLSGQDHIVDFQVTRDFMCKALGPEHKVIIYNETFHELFREPEKEQVFSDMMNWILTIGDKNAKK
ncbi:MAG: alpha/beta fold hydrolase [Bacteriovoracaceae bacterium]|nr:alpha/beta fold hydrolase [Bacteriovoracaceae bacterium]